MGLVRVLLVLGLGVIAIAALLYLFTRDRRYLRFIGRTMRYAIVLLLAVFVYFAVERLTAH
jgi:hypothetical protein